MNTLADQDLLIVEDNPGDLVLLAAMLEEAFLKERPADSASTLAEALERMAGKYYPLILLDLALPDSVGVQTYRAVRQRAPQAIVIVLTGNNDDRVAIDLLHEGAQDYLVKGQFDATALGRVIRYSWERRQFERELTVRRAWWEALVQTIPDAVVISDGQDRIRFANPAAEGLFGVSVADLAQKDVADLSPTEYREAVRADLESLKAPDSGVRQVPVRHLPMNRTGGESLPAEIIRYAFSAENEVLIVTLVRDISERRRLEHQLVQSQKMEAIGQLTAGVAHDFNNLLAVVVANLDLLSRLLEGQAEAQKKVRSAVGAAQKGAQLTRRLLTFSRIQDLQPRRISVADVVNSTLDMAARTVGPDIQLGASLPEDTPPVFLDPAEFENVLLNLAVNAKDAMPNGGTLRFEVATTHLTDVDWAVRTDGLTPGAYVKLVVTDTGLGMPPDVVEKAFDPFFTTKAQGKGTGLGLSMVYGFAKQSGGLAKIYSEVGVGTAVHLLFPVALGAEGPDAPLQAAPVHRPNPGATALLVDDVPELLDVGSVFLTSLGYRVDAVCDGPSALGRVNGGARYSVLITDILMPGGLNGSQLALAVRQVQPDIKVIFTSGFPSKALADKHVQIDSVLVDKPYVLDDLRRALHQVFGY